MIKTLKEDNGDWTVYDDESMIAATISIINEYSIIPEDEKTRKYRVDMSGKTVRTYIKNFNDAVSAAAEAIRDKK
jgi:hypothetical protein